MDRIETPTVTDAKELMRQMSQTEFREVFVEIVSYMKNDPEIVDLFFAQLTDKEKFPPLPGAELTYEELDRRRTRGLAEQGTSLEEAIAIARSQLAD